MLTENNTYTEFFPSKPIWDISNLEEYQQYSLDAMKNIFEDFKEPKDIPNISEILAQALVLSAEQCFGVHKPRTKPKNIQTPNFSKNLKDAHINHKKTYQKWRMAGRPKNKDGIG